MSYIKAVTEAGDTLIIENYYSSRWNKKNIRRGKNHQKTKESQERCNERKAVRNMIALLNANFKPGDCHLVLDYRPENRPSTPGEAKENIKPFLRKMRRLYKNGGILFRYVEACEFGKSGGLHHHLVISGGVSVEDIRKKTIVPSRSSP